MNEPSKPPGRIVFHLTELMELLGCGPAWQLRNLLKQYVLMSDGERQELIYVAVSRDFPPRVCRACEVREGLPAGPVSEYVTGAMWWGWDVEWKL